MNVGSVHLQASEALPYLTLAYALFFLVIFAYVLTLSRRQAQVRDELVQLRQAVDEERRKG